MDIPLSVRARIVSAERIWVKWLRGPRPAKGGRRRRSVQSVCVVRIHCRVCIASWKESESREISLKSSHKISLQFGRQCPARRRQGHQHHRRAGRRKGRGRSGVPLSVVRSLKGVDSWHLLSSIFVDVGALRPAQINTHSFIYTMPLVSSIHES